MDEFLQMLPKLARKETVPEIPKKLRLYAHFFGQRKVTEYLSDYYIGQGRERTLLYLPCIYMREEFHYLRRAAGIPKKQISLVLIDSNDARTDYFLHEFLEQLNFLTIVTERKEYFESLTERAFQELGLLIDLAYPWEKRAVRGNLFWDFSDVFKNINANVTVGQYELSAPLAESLLVPENFPFRESRCTELREWCKKSGWHITWHVTIPENH